MYAFIDRPVESLGNSGRMLLWATRKWSQAQAAEADPRIALWRGFVRVRALPVLATFHQAMTLLDRHALAALPVTPMEGDRVTENEAILLQMWSDLAEGAVARLVATLKLMVTESAAAPTLAAMTRAAVAFHGAGFDLSALALQTIKETK